MLKKCGLLLIFFGMTTLFCLAQKPDLNDSTVLMKLLEMESAKLDPEAKALVVYEKGKADVIGFTTRYKREGIIKVFNNDIARDVGTIFIPHQGGILLKNLRAQVYNLENGTIQVQSIEQNDLIKEKITDGMRVIKVYLPGVKKGSLIAYQYEREAGNMSLLQTTWEFQGDYPCLHSEFEANIPGHIIYEPIVRINSKLLSSTSKEELEKPGEAVVYREGVAELAISNN